jgi:hypothetical protein
MSNVSGAASWSKDRIREEIRSREREIDNIRENIDERESEYEADGYRNAESGWSNRLYKEMDDLESEISHLKSLL